MPKSRSNIDMVAALKHWRAKRGYSQSRLAQVTGTSALTIGQLESGKRKARGATLAKILQGLNVSEDEFFDMRAGEIVEGAAPAVIKPVEMPRSTAPTKDSQSLRLSNLDLELLNRVLNLDFETKLEALRFLENLK